MAAARSFKRVAGLAAVAPGGEESGDIAAGGGQGRDPVLVAPDAPGAHRGAVGGAGVFGLRAAAIGAGGFVRRGQAAIVLRFFRRRQDVEPVPHGDRRAAHGRVRGDQRLPLNLRMHLLRPWQSSGRVRGRPDGVIWSGGHGAPRGEARGVS